MKYNHTSYGFLVDDISKTVNFYRDTMGFLVVRQSDTFAQMNSEGKCHYNLGETARRECLLIYNTAAGAPTACIRP